MKNKIIAIILIFFAVLTLIVNYNVQAFTKDDINLLTNKSTEQETLISLANESIESGDKIMKYDARTNETTEVDMEELRNVIASKYTKNSRNSSSYILNSYNPNEKNTITNPAIQPYSSGMEIVRDTSVYPNIAVCKVFSGSSPVGTAALIGPNSAITAAHCVFDTNNNDAIIPNWTIYAGYNEETYYGTPCGWDQVYYSETWKNNHTYKNDWAICVLQSNLGDQVGYLGVEARTESSELKNKTVYALGYPVDLSLAIYGDVQYRTDGKINLVSDYGFRFDGWTTNGFSGGPVMDNDEYKDYNVIVGVVSSKEKDNNVPYCAAITPEMADIVASLR